MEKKDAIRQFWAGIFFIVGIVLIFSFIFIVGKDKGFSQPKFQVSVLFRNVGGLNEGAPVRLSGVTIGNVGSIDFLDQEYQGRKVGVALNIFTKYRKQLQDATNFTIKTEGVLGEKLIEIDTIENQPKVNLEAPIIGEDPLDVSDLAEVFAGAAESFTKTSEELSKINLVEVTEVMVDSSRALLNTSRGINAIMAELQDIAKKSKRMFDRLEQQIIDGTLFKVF